MPFLEVGKKSQVTGIFFLVQSCGKKGDPVLQFLGMILSGRGHQISPGEQEVNHCNQ